jgi:hypothetical protein
MGEIQEDILVTTATISGVCILMLPCLARTEPRYFRHAAWAGVVLIVGTGGPTIVLVWLGNEEDVTVQGLNNSLADES